MKKIPLPWNAGICLTLFFAVFYPRLVYLGSFPWMDEGYYVWQAMRIHAFIKQTGALPPDGTLALYPLLTSWLCSVPGSIFIWMRLADMIAALAEGCLFCIVLRLVCKNGKTALLLAFIFLAAMNSDPVIEGGFKNSIAVAFIPLFLAFILTARASRPIAWLGAGGLTALGVLLREPLAIFAVLGFIAIWHGWNFKTALHYAAGGIITGLCFIIAIAIWRGDVLGIISGYVNTADVYADQSYRTMLKFIGNGKKALAFFWWPLAAALYGFVFFRQHKCGKLTHSCQTPKDNDAKKQLFWVGAAFLPLLEPTLKVGFLYHFAVCLPGLGGLCALTWKNFNFSFSQKRMAPGSLLLLAGIVHACFLMPPLTRLPQAIQALAHIESPWKDREEQSNTLLAARAIKAILPPHGTIATSGFTHFLYGAAPGLPPLKGPFDPDDRDKFSDLARSFRSLGKNPGKLAQALCANPPDVIVVARAVEEHEPDYHPDILEAVKKTGLYEKTTEISPAPDKNYGWLGYAIFKKIEKGGEL